jgi:hypothetical protein
MEKPEETVAIDEPMAVEAGDRDVRISIAQDGVLTLTADAAEISGLRLLDAAQKSRSGAGPTD